MKKILSSLIVVLLFAALPVCAEDYKAFDTPVEAEVISEKAFVRADHANASKRIVTMEEGDVMHLLGQWDGGDAYPWYSVKANGEMGWIYGQNLQRLDGKPQEKVSMTAPAAAPDKSDLPQAGVVAADGDYVTVVALGQGVDRAKALEQAWIEAVRLAVGAIISSKSELNNNDFAENTIAHSRGVIESFDIVGEKNDDKRMTVAIQAKVRKEILADAAKTYSESQTVKANTTGAVKAQMNVAANESTAGAKQASGVALLKEVLDAYGPEMFYTATLNPKIEYNKEDKKSYINITQKFNQDLFWKEFIPRLHKALEGVAAKKEKKFYADSVRQANQRLTKEGYIQMAGIYTKIFYQPDGKPLETKEWAAAVPFGLYAPYSWYDEKYDSPEMKGYKNRMVFYPSGGFLAKTTYGDEPFRDRLWKVIVPNDSASYTVYHTQATLTRNGSHIYENTVQYTDEQNIRGIFNEFLNKMISRLRFSITYTDSEGNEIHTQIIDMGNRFVTTYRSYFAEEGEKNRLTAYLIPEAVAFAPGYVNASWTSLFLGSANFDQKYKYGFEIELDANDMQKLDSMKFEYIFENQ